MTSIFRASLGLIVWAVGFSLVYALHGLGCAQGWPTIMLGPLSLFRWALLGSWAIAILAGFTVLVWSWHLGTIRSMGPFEVQLSQVLAIVGLSATAVSYAPIAFSAACL